MNFDRVSSSIHSNPRKGIGEYEGNINTRKTKRRALCIAKIALNILLGSALLSTIALSAVLCPLSLILSIPISIAAAAFSIKQIMKICNEIKGIKHTAPSTHTLIPEEIEKKGPKLGEWDDTRLQCAPFRDCMQSFEFKKKLIENAEQEILISGSYCGRRAFDEILDAMEKRMQEKPDLRVHILTATRFVTDQDKFKSKNWKRIQELTEKYPNRFFTVFSFETFQANPNRPGFKYISNHAKLLIVDRKAMITGGGGIEDRWAYSNGLNSCKSYQEEGFVNASIAKTFRDKDFLLYCDAENSKQETQSVIERSALEFYQLFTRWHHFDETVKQDHQKLKEIRAVRNTELDPFHNFYHDLNQEKSHVNVSELVEGISSGRKASCNRTKVFMSGPEQVVNEMEKELIQLIADAKKRIVVNHMYFHPTSGVRNALKDAARRGVQIDILTNGYKSTSPKSHKVFAPRSIFNARMIARAGKDNVSLHCWDVEHSTNHQKIILIDDRYALCGSSNLGHKGFNSMSDYEHNILIDSPDISRIILKDFKKDRDKYSEEFDVEKLKKLPGVLELFSTALHHYLQARIG